MRKIDKIIIHCSATPENRETTVEDIRLWHKQRGFKDIGYHYIIYLDGSIHEGRPIEQVGAHCKGQNAHSIGVCYVGGCDKNMNPKDTRTAEQKESLRLLLIRLKSNYPDAVIYGHRDFANKACPCYCAKLEYADISATGRGDQSLN